MLTYAVGLGANMAVSSRSRVPCAVLNDEKRPQCNRRVAWEVSESYLEGFHALERADRGGRRATNDRKPKAPSGAHASIKSDVRYK